MGALLSLFASSEKTVDLLYQRLDADVAQRSELLNRITNYQGCQELTKAAIKNATPENELAAFNALLIAVESVDAFYTYSKNLEQHLIPDLLCLLAENDAALQSVSAAAGDEAKAAGGLSRRDYDALARQLAELLTFALEFDEKRMGCQHLSNDFSYYRRLLNKFEKPEHRHPGIKVGLDKALHMAQHTADHIPMINSVAKGAAIAMTRAGKNAQNPLVTIANACMSALKSKIARRESDTLFLGRAMTCAIVVYDLTFSPELGGAFGKKSPIQVKQCGVQLKRCLPHAHSLRNFIRFSTKNFADAPDNIKAEFED